MSPAFETMHACCDEKEAVHFIQQLIEDEGADQDDIWVIRGEEIDLQVQKPEAIQISFNGKKVL